MMMTFNPAGPSPPSFVLKGLALAHELSSSAWTAHNWTYKHGALVKGNDLASGNYTFEEARAHCAALTACVGFTFHSSETEPVAPVPTYFKMSETTTNGDSKAGTLELMP
jgi:hypothetical protein